MAILGNEFGGGNAVEGKTYHLPPSAPAYPVRRKLDWRSVAVGAVVAAVLAWAGAVSYGAYRGYLAAAFLERTLQQQQAAAKASAPPAVAPTPGAPPQ